MIIRRSGPLQGKTADDLASALGHASSKGLHSPTPTVAGRPVCGFQTGLGAIGTSPFRVSDSTSTFGRTSDLCGPELPAATSTPCECKKSMQVSSRDLSRLKRFLLDRVFDQFTTLARGC